MKYSIKAFHKKVVVKFVYAAPRIPNFGIKIKFKPMFNNAVKPKTFDAVV